MPFTHNTRTLTHRANAAKVIYEGQEHTLLDLETDTATRTAMLTHCGVAASTEVAERTGYSESNNVVQNTAGADYTDASQSIAYATERRQIGLYTDTTA